MMSNWRKLKKWDACALITGILALVIPAIIFAVGLVDLHCSAFIKAFFQAIGKTVIPVIPQQSFLLMRKLNISNKNKAHNNQHYSKFVCHFFCFHLIIY